MATSSTYTVKLPKILDIIEYNGFFNLPNVRITISDRDTGNVLYNDIPTTEQISFSTAIGADLRITAAKAHYKSEVRAVYLGNPENGVYRFIKRTNDKELVIIALNREEGYCGSGEKMIDYVHAFYTRKFNDFTLTEPQKVLVSSTGVARDLTSKLNVCLTNPLSLPSDITTFKDGFVAELNDQDELHTIYVKGPSNEDETDLNYVWGSNHAYIFEDAFKLHVIEKNREYLTFEAYDSSVDEFSVKLMQYGTPNSAVIQYRYFDKDSGKSINSTGGTTYIVTSSEMTQIRGSFATGKTCTISSARVNFTLYDRISCDGVVYDVEETEDGGYRLVESTTDYEWTNYTFGTLLTSNDNGVVIQFRRSPENDSHYFSKDTSNFYYFDVTNGYVNVYGSVNTLLSASDNITLDVTDANDKYIFYRLFGYQNTNRIKKVKNLKLKSTVLTEGCYAFMFNGCNFAEVPLIDAESVREHSCESMFASNASLYMLPDTFFIFNIRNLYEYSYGGMFYDCANLTLSTSQTITVDSCGEGSCNSMFKNCSNNRHCNVYIGAKTALNIPEKAFYGMFYENTKASLSYIKINAGNVGTNGFAEMFYDCGKLIFPEDISEYWLSINGTIGTNGCYKMFEGCSYLNNESSVSLSIFTTSVGVSGCSRMFYGCSRLKVPVLFPNHASNLTTSSYCFSKMFYGCEKLSYGPSIKLTTLANYACEYMFYGCKELMNASSVFTTNAITTGNYSCQYMFAECSNLVVPIDLKNATFSTGCFSHMFENCVKLKDNGSFEFTTSSFPDYSCEYMFAGTEKLEFAGLWENVNTVGKYACQYMFLKSGLKYTPKQGGINLDVYCYYHMFDSCYLYSDFKLRADVLPECCYSYMYYKAIINSFKKTFNIRKFNSCGVRAFSHMFDSANSRDITGGIIDGYLIIKRIGFNDTLSQNQYYMKLYGNRSAVKNAADMYNNYNAQYYYWTLPYRTAFRDSNHIAMIQTKMRLGTGASTITTGLDNHLDSYDLRFSNGDKFHIDNFLSSTATTSDYIYDYFDHEYNYTYPNKYVVKKIDTEPIEINFSSQSLGNYCCEYMFYNCSFVYEADRIKFINTNLSEHAFSHMFDSCPNLTSIPDLTSINSLGRYCYEYMFANCDKLVCTSTFNGVGSDANFFYGLKILKLIGVAQNYNDNMLMYRYYMFGDNITNLPVGCCSNMFRNCKKLIYGPFIQNKTINTDCYKEMFYGCNSLKRIFYNSSTKPTDFFTSNWTYNASSSGNFYKGTSATWNNSDANIPSNWTITENVTP